MNGALVEIRRYVAYPGRRADLANYMDRIVIPFVRAREVEVTASLIDLDDDDAYIWIRTFENEEDRARKCKYEAIYENAEWTDTIRPAAQEVMRFERAVTTTARPTTTPS